jgi:hypothetical protein
MGIRPFPPLGLDHGCWGSLPLLGERREKKQLKGRVPRISLDAPSHGRVERKGSGEAKKGKHGSRRKGCGSPAQFFW